MSSKITIEMMVHPEKYGLVECTHCNGYGSSLKEESDTCSKCGGDGLVKKEETDANSKSN